MWQFPSWLTGSAAAGAMLLFAAVTAGCAEPPVPTGDRVRDLQAAAIHAGKAEFGHWGEDPANYKAWASHSNRLIPVYTFGTRNAGPGIDLNSYLGANSPYRSEKSLQRIYGRLPSHTLNPTAEYGDQTNLFDIQKAALDAGKKHIFLVIFDGMDWQSTWSAAIYKSGKVSYREGRGTGLHFLDYTAGDTTQFGYVVTSPHNAGTDVDADAQTVKNPNGTQFGGYDPVLAGVTPWGKAPEMLYPISKNKDKSRQHAYTDSSCSASSMTTGIKSYNGAVNVDYAGHPVATIAHLAQEVGYAVGAVSSVPISHATPAASYAHNVERDDYQDLTRDMLGLKSISHPDQPLPGLDVVIGGGYGDDRKKDAGQGKNVVPGNAYLTADDLKAVNVKTGGKYVTAVRSKGVNGAKGLQRAAEQAAKAKQRLLGFYGVGTAKGHLPYRTADGDFKPTVGRSDKQETYTPADLDENPTLADMTTAALTVLSSRDKFWLMVEPGDVDWANHDNNIDNSIGAVISGDEAVKAITDWVEKHSNWNDSVLIVTADHGHYFHLVKPELLLPSTSSTAQK
ncbi:MAG TPA: alkaline phosphatase [Planctomycetaceae bacterium]|nr:alkaline phosphatase [Planctomycetaceae bacterium]